MQRVSDIEKLLLISNMGEDSISIVDVNSLKEVLRISLPESCKDAGRDFITKKPRVGPHCLKAYNGGSIYCVNSYDDSIYEIFRDSFKIKDSFFAGSHPNDMVFSKDGACMYVTNGDSDSISIIETYGRRIIGQITVGLMPHGICISPDGEYIYVANMNSDSVSIIDTWSNSMVSCINTGKCPIDVLTSHDGRHLYVTCSYMGQDRKGTLSIISTVNYKVIKNIELGMIPSQMKMSEDRRYLYVTNMGSNDVFIIDLNKFEVVKKINAGKMPRGIDVTDEYIFITGSQDNCLTAIRKENAAIKCNIEVGKEPTSILFLNNISH